MSDRPDVRRVLEKWEREREARLALASGTPRRLFPNAPRQRVKATSETENLPATQSTD